jgi:DNA-binding HxlR family transcriptional regulator
MWSSWRALRGEVKAVRPRACSFHLTSLDPCRMTASGRASTSGIAGRHLSTPRQRRSGTVMIRPVRVETPKLLITFRRPWADHGRAVVCFSKRLVSNPRSQFRARSSAPAGHRPAANPSRFNEIRRRLDGITHKALADALKRLERSGLVRRDVLPTTPVGVRYTITPLAKTQKQPLAGLYDWALTHGPELEHHSAALAKIILIGCSD